MPNVEDIAAQLLCSDVVWVGGGSVAALLALWRLHEVDAAMAAAWRAGVVLTGVSAGSICWHVGGTTDSYGPSLRPVTDGLGFVPYSNGVHYDSEPERRPLFHRLIAQRTIPPGYATDDGVGVVYRGTSFAGAIAENQSGGAYFVDNGTDGVATEVPLDVVRLV
jgi:peptidase E